MTEDDFAADIESDWAVRQGELLFLQNVASNMSEEDADRYRRSLVVMLYANFEGGVKFALQTYVRFLNELDISVSSATSAIAAASISDVMQALRDPSRKCEDFRSDLPDDSALHRFARDREFFDVLPGIMERKVVIPDRVVDTDSNLKPVTLKKILYRLGLDHGICSRHDPQINKLLAFRNRIAHGESSSGVSEEAYESLRNAVFEAVLSIASSLRSCVRERVFLRSCAA